MNRQLASSRSPERRLRMGLTAGLVWLLLAAPMAVADEEENPIVPFTPLQLSIVPGAQAFPQNVPIRGFRINALYGRQQELTGVDFGLMNEVDQDMAGAAVGLLNIVREDAHAIQAGVANSVGEKFTGLQLGLTNQVGTNLRGLQLGIGNAAEDVAGLQLGLLNRCESLKGLQLGLLNFNKSGLLPFFPGFNFGF